MDGRPPLPPVRRRGRENHHHQYYHQVTLVVILVLVVLSLFSDVMTTTRPTRPTTKTTTTTMWMKQQQQHQQLIPSSSSSSLSSSTLLSSSTPTTTTTTKTSVSTSLYYGSNLNGSNHHHGSDDDDFEMKEDIGGNGVIVTVGRMGPAVHHAIRHGLPQRMPRTPRSLFDILGNTTCVIDDDGTNSSSSDTVVDSETGGMAAAVVVTPPHRDEYLPEAIVLGVQKCGTTALYDYLIQHPDVAETRKELYFLDEQVDEMLLASYYYNVSLDGNNPTNGTEEEDPINLQHGGIHQQSIRRRYGEVIRNSMRYPLRDRGKMVIDLTPNYFFKSSRVAGRISCLVPWVKLLVLLRNPIERTRSQYDMKLKYTDRGNRTTRIPTYAEYIRNDLAALREVGVIQDWSVVDFDTYFESDAMREAWRTYENSGLNAPVGMGLYALQIRPYLELPNDLLVIRSEDLKNDAEATFSRVAKFLGLRSLDKKGMFNDKNNNHIVFSKNVNSARTVTGIDESIEATLRDVFDPFNRKLAEMLGEEWDGIWDKEKVTRRGSNLRDRRRPTFGRHYGRGAKQQRRQPPAAV